MGIKVHESNVASAVNIYDATKGSVLNGVVSTHAKWNRARLNNLASRSSDFFESSFLAIGVVGRIAIINTSEGFERIN